MLKRVMTKAEIMFGKLGYELRKYTDETILYRGYGDIFIEFDGTRRVVKVYELLNTSSDETTKVPAHLEVDEIQAINQQ